MITHLAWQSKETSTCLTPIEVDELFALCVKLHDMGLLNGKFKHASTPLYWQRLPKEN